jgi:hypothetical protein
MICGLTMPVPFASAPLTIGRSPVVRDLRVKDANKINSHLPIIVARLALPETNPEEITEVACLVWSVV